MPQSSEIVAAARGNVYRFLSLGLSYPDAALLVQLKALLPSLEAGLEALDEDGGLAPAGSVGAALGKQTLDDWRKSYLQSFGHTISKECPPYETEYGQTHIFEKSQSLADIAGFYRAFGVDLAPDLNDRLDHISVELEFMQLLCVKESYALAQGHAAENLALCRDAEAEFLEQHLGRWAFGFVRKLQQKSEHGLHGLVAELLASFLSGEMRRFGLEPPNEVELLLQEPLEEEPAACQACTVASPAAMVEQGKSP